MLDEQDVRAFVAQGSGLNAHSGVIEGNSRGKRPSGTYADLLLIDDVPQGLAAHQQEDNGQTVTQNWYRATFSLQFYRKGAVDRARRFRMWAESELGLMAADDSNFRVVFPLTVQRLDLPVEAAIEERALIDFAVDYVHHIQQQTGIIDDIAVDLTVETPGGTVIEAEVTHGA